MHFPRTGPEFVAEAEAAEKPSVGGERHAGACIAGAGPIRSAEAVDHVAHPAFEARTGLFT